MKKKLILLVVAFVFAVAAIVTTISPHGQGRPIPHFRRCRDSHDHTGVFRGLYERNYEGIVAWGAANVATGSMPGATG